MGAWAGTTTLLEYGTADKAWTDALVAEWTATGTTATKEDSYVQVSGGNGDNYLTKTITPTANSILNIKAVWRGRSHTGRTFAQGNASYFRFGNILVAQNDQDQKHGYGFAGLANLGSVTTFSCGSYRTDIENLDFLLIEMEINTVTNTLTSFTVKSEDGSKTYVSQSNVVLTNTDYTTVAFGYKKGGSVSTTNKENLKSILITETTQEVSTAGYTINYKYGGSIIKQVSSTAAVGATVNAESSITVDNTRYYTADGAETSLPITADETANVLDVELREPYTKTVSINAVDEDGNVLKTFSTECVEGEAAKNLFYTRAVEKNGKYYTIAAANTNGTNYGKSVSFTSSDEDKEYTLDETITYYAEAENMGKSRSNATQNEGAVPDRASGGHWYRIYPKAHVYTAALSEGIYKIDLSARNEGSSTSTLNVKLRDSSGNLTDIEKSAEWASAGNSVQTVEDIVVPEGYSIAIENEAATNSGAALDYIIVYKTGEAITIPNNENGLGSYVTTDALDFSGVDGLKAYVATAEKTDKVVITQVSEVPAGTPIFVRGTAGETYPVPVGSCTTAPQGNLLRGNATTSYTVADGEKVYALKASTGMLTPVTAGVTIPAKKAYLVSTTGSASAKLSVVYAEDEEEEATAVNVVEAAAQTGAKRLFNAAGQQVGIGYKGLVIDESGKKYVRK